MINITYFYTSAKSGVNINELFLHAFKLVFERPIQVINLHEVTHCIQNFSSADSFSTPVTWASVTNGTETPTTLSSNISSYISPQVSNIASSTYNALASIGNLWRPANGTSGSLWRPANGTSGSLTSWFKKS